MSRPALPSRHVEWRLRVPTVYIVRCEEFFSNAPKVLARNKPAAVQFSACARERLLMAKPKVAARLDNIVFLSNIGASLRWATSEIARENLPDEIVRLLRRLDRVEQRQSPRGVVCRIAALAAETIIIFYIGRNDLPRRKLIRAKTIGFSQWRDQSTWW